VRFWVGNQIFCDNSGHCLAHTVAVAVIDQLHASGPHQSVLKVVNVGADAAVQQVAIGVIRIGGGAIVCVVIQQARSWDGMNSGVPLQPVADRVVLIADRSVL
jgi:hypothetical protein